MDGMNDGFNGWSWFLWIGLWFLILSSFGNWGYAYSTHRRYRKINHQKNAHDYLKERYAKGEISREEFREIKQEISGIPVSTKKSEIHPLPTEKQA